MSRRRSARPVESLGGLPQRITAARQRLGLSPRAFAKRLGVTSGMVGRWERGAQLLNSTEDALAVMLELNKQVRPRRPRPQLLPRHLLGARPL